MKKRIFSILLTICMVLSLVPTAAFAAGQVHVDLWIGDVSFKETETNVTKNITGGGTAKLQRGTDSSTLTLNGITVSFDSANMAAIESDISNLTIVLNGTNTINLNNTDTVGIHLMKNTTIKGNSGSQLIINSNYSGNSCINVDEGISLTMDNTTMTVNYSATSGAVVGIVARSTFALNNTCSFKVNTSMSADSGDTLGYVGNTTGSTLNIGSNANVTFDGWENAVDIDGTMNLSGGTMTIRNSYDGIYHEGTLNLTGGTLNTSGSRLGILTGPNGIIKFAGTNATVVGGTAGWGWVDESATYSITGGKVVLQGGSYAASNIYSSIADGYSVYAGSSESNAQLISSPQRYTFKENKYVRIEPKTYYTLTLVNVKGTTSASHLAGANISYTAADAPSEQHFAYWTMKVGSAAATKVGTNATYTGKMPAGNATLTAVYENCSGGTSTCQAKAKCSVCGKEYGILALHSFTAEVVDQKYAVTAATCTSGGTYYKSCPVCGASSQYWSNATFSVSALGHSFTEKIEDNAHYVSGTGTDCTSVKKYYYDCANCNQIGTATWNSTTYGPHNYSTAWSSDETGHWHACQNSGCKEVSGFSAHTPDREAATVNNPIKCTECAYIITPAPEGDDAVLQNLLNNGGTVKLEKDYVITTSMLINSDVTLDLNGYVIKMTGSDSVFKIFDSKTLTLNDSRPTLAHTGDYESLPAGGVITGGNAKQGGGVYIESGSFIMNGGTIRDCSANFGGGVYIYQNCSFTMNGGTIDNCKAIVSSCDAVYNQSNIYANGGSIHGGVYLNRIGNIQNTSSTGVTVFWFYNKCWGK